MRTNLRYWMMAAVLASCAGLALAATVHVPGRMNFQGVLRDSTGAAVTGSHAMSFHLYDSGVDCPGGGTLLLSDDHASVPVSGGLFNVVLGGGVLTPGAVNNFGRAFREHGPWVEIEIGGETLCPRVRVESTAYAQLAGGLGTFDDVGIGTTSPSARLDVVGTTELNGDVTVTGGNNLAVGGSMSVDEDLTLSDGSVLRAARADPPCFDNFNRFKDCLNGTVTDTVTGLIWLKDADCPALGGLQFWVSANQAVAGLSQGTCDLTDNSSAGDWRLPTKDEWQVIVDQGRTNCLQGPFVPDTEGLGCWSEGDPFSGVQSFIYWSSTTNASNPNVASFAIMSGGIVTAGGKTGNYYVWPVRGGP